MIFKTKTAEERQQASEAKAEERREARRARYTFQLIKAGVLAGEDDAADLTDTDLARLLRTAADEAVTGMKQDIRMEVVLGIRIKDGIVSKAGTVLNATLGPLAGAHTEVTDLARQHRAGAAATASIITASAGLGPTGALVGLSKKYTSAVIIVFPDGTTHLHGPFGVWMIRQAQCGSPVRSGAPYRCPR